MTAFEKPSFSVNPSGAKAPAECKHGWADYRGKCVLCGERIESPSQQLKDHAARIGGTIVSMTKTYRIDSQWEPCGTAWRCVTCGYVLGSAIESCEGPLPGHARVLRPHRAGHA